VILTLLSEGAL